MRRVVALLASVGLFLSVLPGVALASPSAQVITSEDRIPGSWIVTLRDNVDASENAARLARDAGGRVGFIYEHALNGFSFKGSDAAAGALSRNPAVARVESDGPVWLVETVQSNATWGLDRIDDRSGLDGTYTYAYDGTGVTAYIIDTGIRISHNEFGSPTRATYGYDSIDNDLTSEDCHGHGTHVAGTVGGSLYGVAKNVQLVAVRVLNCNGSGSWEGVIAGIDWVTADAVGQPAVANMSLGGGANSSVDDAVRTSIASGVSYAIAAGNGNRAGIAQDACGYSPARVQEAMTIGATNSSDAKASWSNYGDCVDWFAPGVSITSAWIDSDSDTHTISGTSMATPHTAGVAALYLDAANTLVAPLDVRNALFAATTKGIVTSSNTANNHLLYSLFAPPATDETDPPTAEANGPYPGSEDTAVTFDSTGSNDPDLGGLTYTWDFGDESPAVTTENKTITHTYLWGGTFTVTLTVTDASGQTATDTATAPITEANDPPIAEAGGPYSGSINHAITFDASDSSDFDNEDKTSVNDQDLSYSWDFTNDGVVDTTTSSATVTHTYTAAGTYTVSVTVSDGTASTSDTATATVTEASTTMHVADLEALVSGNNGSSWTGNVRVTVRDGNGVLVTNATVQGTFTWSTGSVDATCDTGETGICVISGSGIPKKVSTATFMVTGITGSLTYVQSDDVETSVVVSKP